MGLRVGITAERVAQSGSQGQVFHCHIPPFPVLYVCQRTNSYLCHT